MPNPHRTTYDRITGLERQVESARFEVRVWQIMFGTAVVVLAARELAQLI